MTKEPLWRSSGSLLCRMVKGKGHDEISETQVLTKKIRERIPPGWKRLPVEATFKNEIRFFEEGQVTQQVKR